MLKLMLYCDLSTMKCTSDDINRELAQFSSSYVQVNNSLWFFKYDDDFNSSCLQKDEVIFYEYFEKHLKEDSIIFISLLNSHDSRGRMYQLPAHIDTYLQEHQ